MGGQTIRSKPIDKWIPWFFVLFFLVVASLDGIFVTLALKTHTGTVTENAYEKGLAYDEALQSAHAQAVLGWQSVAEYKDGHITTRLQDKNGVPLDGAVVVAKMTRPVQDGYDFEVRLEAQGQGAYSAPVRFPLQGQWNVRIFATWQDTPYQKSQMINVR